MELELIEKPTLLLNETRARRNITRMAEKARRQGVRFRPHFKTHQSAQMGEWFREAGVRAITVSSVDMARYFAETGWDDILIAFSANLRQLHVLDELAGRVHLELLVESPEAAAALDESLTHPVDTWIKVDVGNHRTGIPVDDHAQIQALVRQIRGSRRCHLRGLLTHAGHTYHASGPREIKDIYLTALDGMLRAQEVLGKAGWSGLELSYGDTPSCTLVEDLSGLDEIRPGNFVFYDLMQHELGVCPQEDVAVAVACPVVARHAEGGAVRLVLYGGAVHLSKEFISLNGGPVYGALAVLTPEGWGELLPGAFLYSLSQEHGLARVTPAQAGLFPPGSLAAVVPVHSCLAVDLFSEYLTVDGRKIPIKR